MTAPKPLTPAELDAVRHAAQQGIADPQQRMTRGGMWSNDTVLSLLATIDAVATHRWVTPRGHRVIAGAFGQAVELADGTWHCDPHNPKEGMVLVDTEAKAIAYVTGRSA